MKNDTSKEAFWKDHVEQCGSGDESQQDYCRRNNLALSTFGYWKRKLSRHSEKTRFYPLVVSDVKEDVPGISTGISLHLEQHHLRIELTEEFSMSALKRVMTVLEDM